MKGIAPPKPPSAKAPPPLPKISEEAKSGYAQAAATAEANKVIDPVEEKKEQLLADPVFAKYPKLMKMRVPL